MRNALVKMFLQVNKCPGFQFGILFNLLLGRAGNKVALGFSLSTLGEMDAEECIPAFFSSNGRGVPRLSAHPGLGISAPLSLISSRASHRGVWVRPFKIVIKLLQSQIAKYICFKQTHVSTHAHATTKSSPESIFPNGSYKFTLN